MATIYHPIAQRSSLSPARLLNRVPRLVRFGLVGGTCSLLQLLFLGLLVQANVELHLANVLGFLISTQLNFALSSLITWRDRFADHERTALLARRLAGYNGLALISLTVNQAVFTVAALSINYLAAAVLGILAGMLLNYLVSGQLIFRRLAHPNLEP
jgi:putative flippase GtrA